jgi:DNA invertase Pin-like site-specific DNA recombinase
MEASMTAIKRVALYARVSTIDQNTENQLVELRCYAEVRGWSATEYVDHGVSGAKDRRPALDQLVADAKRRKFDIMVAWRLDRVGRNLRHLVVLLEELQAIGVAFISLNEGIDLATPAGRLQLHILAALSEFERARIQERILAGLARARKQGTHLGRRPSSALRSLDTCAGLSHAAAATRLGVSVASIKRWRRVRRQV